MKNANQQEIDAFMDYALANEEMLPYLSMNRWIRRREAKTDDWQGLCITDDRNSYLLNIDFDRSSGMRFTLCLFAKSAIAAGRAILVIKEMVKRYKPYAIDSMVAKSNTKSFEITKRILGEPWGLEPNGCWNMLKGEFEDCYYFRKLL